MCNKNAAGCADKFRYSLRLGLLFVHGIGVICGITSCRFLHAAGEGIFGGAPVGILIAVIEFVTEPVQIIRKPLQLSSCAFAQAPREVLAEPASVFPFLKWEKTEALDGASPGYENKVHSMLLQLPFHEAERAFVIRPKGIH